MLFFSDYAQSLVSRIELLEQNEVRTAEGTLEDKNARVEVFRKTEVRSTLKLDLVYINNI